MSKLPKKEFLPDGRERSYGFFGYAGYCCDLAIKNDDPEMIAECIERGFLDSKCITLAGTPVAVHAERIGSTRIVDHLKSLNFPCEQ